MMTSDLYVVVIQDGITKKHINVMAMNRSRAHGTVRRHFPDAHVEDIQEYPKGLLIDTSMVSEILEAGRRAK